MLLTLCEIAGRYLGGPGIHQVFNLPLAGMPAQGLLLDSSVYSLFFSSARLIAVGDSFLQKGELQNMHRLLPRWEGVFSRVTQSSFCQ